ncbi:MAG: hypothetical protein ACRDSP_10825 [Pseudonocardiaceae bacterium]
MPSLRPVVVMLLSEVQERIALRRISQDRIAMFQGHYFDHGHRLPDYLLAALESLIERELAVLAEAGEDLWRRATLTPAGRAYYTTLCAQSRHHPDPPPGSPPLQVGADPAGHRPSPDGARPGSALTAEYEPGGGEPRTRWVWVDSQAHVLADNDPEAPLRTRCGKTLHPTMPIYSVIPSHDMCPHCALSGGTTPLPQIPTVF